MEDNSADNNTTLGVPASQNNNMEHIYIYTLLALS